jgi:predicted nucleotidyltransferase
MKEPSKYKRRPEMLPEYDFSRAQRGKYAQRYKEGTNIIVLDPDVSRIFRTSESVNETLRELSKIIRRHAGVASH